MMLWLILGAMMLATAASLLGPLLAKVKTMPSRAEYDLEIYVDQLAEVTREEARGLVAPEEARAAERELARRMLARVPAETTAAKPPGGAPRRWIAWGVAIAPPLAALALYILVGAPGAPDFPLTARDQAQRAETLRTIGAVVAGLEARLKAEPDNLDGWLSLGRSYTALDRLPEAAEAYRRAASLSHDRPDIVSGFAESLVAQASGTVGAEARRRFEEVHAKAPGDARASFYLALAKAQAGDGEGAVADWLALEAEAPADAPWRPEVDDQIKRVAKEFNLDIAKLASTTVKTTAPPAATAPAVEAPGDAQVAAAADVVAEQRTEMSRALVARLADHVRQEPDDLDGWRRLGRAYAAFGEQDNAVDALAHAAKLAPKDADVLSDYGDALIGQAAQGDDLPPQAVAVMREVLALDDRRPQALWFVGRAAAEQGDRATAASLWQHLLTLLPADTDQHKAVSAALDALARR